MPLLLSLLINNLSSSGSRGCGNVKNKYKHNKNNNILDEWVVGEVGGEKRVWVKSVIA